MDADDAHSTGRSHDGDTAAVPPAGAGHAPYGPGSPMPPQPRSRFGRVWPALVLLVLLVVLAGLFLQRDRVADWLAARGYRPSAAVQQLAKADGLSAYAQRLLYANRPEIEGRAAFNAHCSDTKDQVTVLGCYLGNRHGIYIYDVTDKRLAGIQEVTAAHEMLHQAYDRLSARERATVNAQLVAYAKTVTDPTLLDKIAAYKKVEPGQLVNEYHSVFGTEVDTLPPGLEKYYSRYFSDRHAITRLHDQYQAAFTERTKQIDAYDAQIAALKKQIDDGRADIASREASLRAQRAQLDADLAADRISEYNAAVPGFNAQVAQYKTVVAQTNTLISQYNALVDARNNIAVEEQQLQQALDSHAPQPAQQ